MKLSIVVPAFNEERLLTQTLRHIHAAIRVFSNSGWSSELIVCDNNSTDRTAEIASAAGTRPYTLRSWARINGTDVTYPAAAFEDPPEGGHEYANVAAAPGAGNRKGRTCKLG